MFTARPKHQTIARSASIEFNLWEALSYEEQERTKQYNKVRRFKESTKLRKKGGNITRRLNK